MSPPKKKAASSAAIPGADSSARETTPVNPETHTANEEGQVPPESRPNEPSPTLAVVQAQLRNLEKAKGKLNAEVATKQKAFKQAKQLADAKRKLAALQAEVDKLRRLQEEEYDNVAEEQEQAPVNSNNNHYQENHNFD